MLFAQLTPSAASNTRKPASVWLTTADSFWRSCSRTRICSSMRRKRRSYSSSFGCTTVSLSRAPEAPDARADRDEPVIGGGADDRSQPQPLVREQLVDAGPVESWVGGVQLFDRPPQHLLQRRAGGDDLLERPADLPAAGLLLRFLSDRQIDPPLAQRSLGTPR